MEKTIMIAPNFIGSIPVYLPEPSFVGCMDDIGDRFLHGSDPIRGREDRLQNFDPQRVYSRAVTDVLTLYLLSESGQQLSKSPLMDIAQVDEKIGREHRFQIRGGSCVREDIRSSRQVSPAQVAQRLAACTLLVVGL